MNENDYMDWLMNQYSIDEMAEREHWEAEEYVRHLESLQEQE